MAFRSWALDQPAAAADVRSALRAVGTDVSQVDDAQWAALLGAGGDELEELTTLADQTRAARLGDVLTFVVNRNLDTAVVAGLGTAELGTADTSAPSLEQLVDEAYRLGATEVCMQGAVPPQRDAAEYLQLLQRIKAAAPTMHVHAYRPPELRDGARRLGLDLADFLAAARDAGLGSVPGTTAQVLDDEVRAALAGSAPVFTAADWLDTIRAAHRAGLRSTSTLVYGHLETRAQQVGHLRTLAALQDETGGITELILMPMLPANAPEHLRAQAVSGPTERETRALHAVARLLLQGRIDHIQVAWTKLGRDTVTAVLAGGADDLGGLLLDGALLPAAGPEAGRQLQLRDVERIAESLGRRPRQRTTVYTDPPADRLLATAPEVRSQ